MNPQLIIALTLFFFIIAPTIVTVALIFRDRPEPTVRWRFDGRQFERVEGEEYDLASRGQTSND